MKALLLSSALITTAWSASAAELTEDRVNEMIEQYLRNNPKVIIESLQAFQLQQETVRIKDQQKAIEEVMKDFNKDKLKYGEAGNPNGDVTIVEFFDYNCPACKMMFESIDALLQEDNNVRVVFVEYPIFGPQSDENAKISFALHALAPEQYYKFHQAIMRTKGQRIDANIMLDTAANLGVNKELLKEEAAKEKYAQYILEDRELAGKLQISGTPAIIVGTHMSNGALSIEQLKEQVSWARSDNADKAAQEKE